MSSDNKNDILNNDNVEGDNDMTKTMLRSAYSSDDTMTVTAPDKPKTEPSGGRDKDNNSSGNGVNIDAAFKKQLLAIYEDPKFQDELYKIRYNAYLLNLDAVVEISDVDVYGTVTVAIRGLSQAQAHTLGLNGIHFRLDGHAWGDIYTGHVLGKVDNPLPNNKDRLSKDEIAASLLGAAIEALQGKIPAGYLQQGGKIGYMKAVYSKTSLGHGEWQENYSGKEFTEDPELTKYYNEGIKQKKEATEARTKELAEAKSLGITDVEYDALKAVRQAQNKFTETTQKVAKATTAKNNVEKAVVQQEAVVKAALEKRDLSLSERESHYEYSYDDFVGRTWWSILSKIEADVKVTQNALDEANNKLNSLKKDVIQADLDIKKAKDESVAVAAVLDKAKKEEVSVKDAVKFTADFFKEATEKYGAKESKLAQEFADISKGKKIRGVDDALKSFEKYKNVLDKKYSVADRNAIANALASVNRAERAVSLGKFSKAFGVIGDTLDAYDVYTELDKAIKTQNWRPFFVKIETWSAGKVATAITAFAFSMITGTALGILGFGLIMALVGSLIDDKLIEKVNEAIGI